MMQATISCPKCSGDMIAVRRSGVLIEHCADCQGVFLDHGELEKILAMEQQDRDRWEDTPDDDDGDRRDKRGRRKSRKRSFFEELFEFD